MQLCCLVELNNYLLYETSCLEFRLNNLNWDQGFNNLKVFVMKKLKNEGALLKKAIVIGENYAKKRGYKGFSATNAAKEKIEALYRLLVHDKLVHPLAKDQEDLASMKHKLALWIAKQLPEDHPLLQ